MLELLNADLTYFSDKLQDILQLYYNFTSKIDPSCKANLLRADYNFDKLFTD